MSTSGLPVDPIDADRDFNQSLLIWRACLTISHSLAISSSIYRLYRRRKRRQVSHDDYFALAALLWDCSFFPTLWIGVSTSRVVLISGSWIAQITFIPLIWCTRISLAFSIARLIPSKQTKWTVSVGLAYLFGGFCIGFLLHISITCSQDINNWMETPPYQCPLSSSTAIARLIADVSSDLALIILPISAFWHRLKLQPTTRRLIRVCFCASMLTAICNIVLGVLLFWHSNSKVIQERAETGFLAMVMPHLLASISLLVCNILVVVTSFYRFLCTEPALKPVGDPHSPPTPRSTIIARVPRTRSGAGTENNTNPQNGISFTGHDRSQDTGTNSDLSNTSASSDYVVLTELFESDLAHSLPEDIENIERSEKI